MKILYQSEKIIEKLCDLSVQTKTVAHLDLSFDIINHDWKGYTNSTTVNTPFATTNLTSAPQKDNP